MYHEANFISMGIQHQKRLSGVALSFYIQIADVILAYLSKALCIVSDYLKDFILKARGRLCLRQLSDHSDILFFVFHKKSFSH